MHKLLKEFYIIVYKSCGLNNENIVIVIYQWKRYSTSNLI